MANLNIRNLDKKAFDKLRVRAAKHGVSIEEEVCQIIYQALCPPKRITLIFKQNFGPKNGINLESQS